MKDLHHRIKKYPDGKFYVEKLTKRNRWLGTEKWECVSFYNGTTEPYGYWTFESALRTFLLEVKFNIIENSKT